MGQPGYQPLGTLPKPRYPAAPARPLERPASQIHPVPAEGPGVSASSSLLGLRTRIPALSDDETAAEAGPMATFLRRLELAAELLRRVVRWWLAADIRKRQLPILVLALSVWVITAAIAWQSQESSTPLLRESISQIRQERARSSALKSSAATAPDTLSAPAVVTTPAENAPPDVSCAAVPARTRTITTARGSSRRSIGGVVNTLAASLRSWFSPEPAAPERVQGNPHRRVWVDMKTGLYYCPGADYYGFGGRERGKVMSQKDAEYEYFQPATGAPCE
jgi:hypothetical protein